MSSPVPPNTFTSLRNSKFNQPDRKPALPQVIAKIDSGASKNYFRLSDQHVLKHIIHKPGPNVTMPDNNNIKIHRQGTLPLPHNVTGPASTGYILPGLKNASLLSLGQFMDSGCWALVNKYVLNIYKDKNLIIQGHRNLRDGLWDARLSSPAQSRSPNKSVNTTQHVNALIAQDKTKSQLADYLHACLFSPCISTLKKAIKHKFLLTWPGIEFLHFEKFSSDSIATAKGHMAQERKNLRSTKSSCTSTNI